MKDIGKLQQRQQFISPWSFYNQKIDGDVDVVVDQDKKVATDKQTNHLGSLRKLGSKSYKQSLSMNSQLFSQKSTELLQNYLKGQQQKRIQRLQKQAIVLKVAQLTQIQNSARIQHQSRRYFESIKKLILLKMINRKLHHESDNIIQNVLNHNNNHQKHQRHNPNNNHHIHHIQSQKDGIFFPKIQSKSVSYNLLDLSQKSKFNKNGLNLKKLQRTRSFSQNQYQIYGEAILQKLNEYHTNNNNESSIQLQRQLQIELSPESPIFQKRFSKAYRANRSLIKNYKLNKS